MEKKDIAVMIHTVEEKPNQSYKSPPANTLIALPTLIIPHDNPISRPFIFVSEYQIPWYTPCLKIDQENPHDARAKRNTKKPHPDPYIAVVITLNITANKNGVLTPYFSKMIPANVFETNRIIRLMLRSQPTIESEKPKFAPSKGNRLYINESPMMVKPTTLAI